MKNPIITKKYRFCAAHKYGNDYNNHGHNYVLEVSITGPVDPDSGWLVDLKHLNEIVKNYVVELLDHSQIERDIDWFKDKQPSSENILIWAWDEIFQRLKQGYLQKLRLVETHSIHTDYYGPGE